VGQFDAEANTTALDESRRHVDAHRFDLPGWAAMLGQRASDGLDGLGIASFGHGQDRRVGFMPTELFLIPPKKLPRRKVFAPLVIFDRV
jgi:hypothetical protein